MCRVFRHLPLDEAGAEDRDEQERDDAHQLDEDVQRRAGGVLQGVAHGVADDGGRVLVGALFDLFDGLLRVIPRTARVAGLLIVRLCSSPGQAFMSLAFIFSRRLILIPVAIIQSLRS